jgi:hypothetical protein
MLRLLRWTAVVAAITLTVSGTPAANADTPPWSGFHSPSEGSRAEVGETVLITGYAYLGEGTPADKVELTFDEGATWADVDGLGSWRYLLTPTQPGDITVRVRAWYNGNLGDTSPPRTLHVGTSSPILPVNCQWGCTFREYEFPQDDIDRLPVELGVRFAVDRPGRLNAVTFERGAYRGAVTIRVWGQGGILLHEHVEPPTTSGRTNATIDPPVQVQPGTDYVVSYYTPEGGYRATENFYIGTLLHAPYIVRADAGVYRYGEGGGFPTDTWNHSNYTIYPYFVY